MAVTVELLSEPPDSGPGAPSCADATELRWVGGSGTVRTAVARGDTTGASNERGCDAVPTTAEAPDVFYTFELDDRRDLVVELTPDEDYDPAMYLWADCDGVTELACHDTQTKGVAERLTVSGVGPGRYVLGLDAFVDPVFGPFVEGSFELRVTATQTSAAP